MSDVPNVGGDPSSTANDVASDVNDAWLEEEYKDSGVMPGPPQPHYQGQPRDDQGRWTAEQQAAAEAQQQQGQQQPSYPPPPGGWSAAAKAEYVRLAQTYPDHPIVQAVQQRESEMNAGMQMYSGLKPYIEQAQQAGTTLPDAIANWMQAENILATDFYNGIGWLCQRFGVNPEQLIAQYYGQPQAQQHDPVLQYVKKLEQQVQGLSHNWEQQQNAVINQELQTFKDDGHIWFDNLEPAMAEIFRFERSQGRDLTLQEAYDAAAWGHPETRAILLQHYYGNGQSNGQNRPPPPSDRGRSLPPGSPIPGVSGQRQPKTSVVDEVSTLWDEMSGI